MARKKHTVEQIIGKLREAEVALSKGQTVLQVCRTLVSCGTLNQHFSWRGHPCLS